MDKQKIIKKRLRIIEETISMRYKNTKVNLGGIHHEF